jgi:hypothetical protein
MGWLIKAWAILRGPLADILRVMILTLKTLVNTEIISIIKFAVDKVANDPTILSNEEKRRVALAEIKDKAGQSGIFIRDWLAGFLLEAVLGLKKLGIG